MSTDLESIHHVSEFNCECGAAMKLTSSSGLQSEHNGQLQVWVCEYGPVFHSRVQLRIKSH